MVQFAEAFPEGPIVATLSRQSAWSHFVLLLPLEAPLARAFFAVPRGGCLVVRQNRKRALDDLTEIGFERSAPLSFRQPAAAVRELMPDRRGNRALRTVAP